MKTKKEQNNKAHKVTEQFKLIVVHSDDFDQKSLNKMKKKLQNKSDNTRRVPIIVIPRNDRVEVIGNNKKVTICIYSDSVDEKINSSLEEQLNKEYPSKNFTVLGFYRDERMVEYTV